jgi:hypothetical protein
MTDIRHVYCRSFLAQLVERVTSNDEVSRSSRLEGILFGFLRRVGYPENYDPCFSAIFGYGGCFVAPGIFYIVK